jgi:ketosteroid isomerase-like protein
MSAQNVEIVRTLFTFWDEDIGRSYELMADDVEIRLAYEMPGFATEYRGHAAVRSFWREWLSAWENVSVREVELTDGGDDEVLGVWTQVMRGSGSDVEMEETQAAIFVLRDGKVTRIRYFTDPDAGRAAFGS